jgi:hypothetical protein
MLTLGHYIADFAQSLSPIWAAVFSLGLVLASVFTTWLNFMLVRRVIRRWKEKGDGVPALAEILLCVPSPAPGTSMR